MRRTAFQLSASVSHPEVSLRRKVEGGEGGNGFSEIKKFKIVIFSFYFCFVDIYMLMKNNNYVKMNLGSRFFQKFI